MKNVKLKKPDEAESGNAGEQPARNSPANWNSLKAGEIPAFRLKLFRLLMPYKTHFACLYDFCFTQFVLAICPFHAGAIQNDHYH